MSIKTEAIVAGLIKHLENFEQTLAELVVDAQDAAEEAGVFSAGFFTGDNDDIPICVPEDADPLLDNARTGVQDALDALREWQEDHPWKPSDDIEYLTKPIACTTCHGTGLDHRHKRDDGSFVSCEKCEGFGDTLPAEVKPERKTPFDRSTGIGAYTVQVTGDYDGDDWVTGCYIQTKRRGVEYSSSLGVLEDFGTLESDRDGTITVGQTIIDKIRKFADDQGY